MTDPWVADSASKVGRHRISRDWDRMTISPPPRRRGLVRQRKDQGTSRYNAFISYSQRRDVVLAAALQSELARYAGSWRNTRRLKIFRDVSNLPAAAGLWPTIEEALEASDWLVLMASPEAAASTWVAREATWWVEHGRQERLLIALSGGSIRWAGDDFDWTLTDAVPRVLAGVFAQEPRWIDLTRVPVTGGVPRIGDSVADFAAPILDVDKDELVGEHLRQRRQTRRLVRATIALLSVLLLVAGSAAVVAFQQAGEARQRTRQVAEQAAVSASRQLQTLSRALIDTNPRVALALGLVSYRSHADSVARRAVFDALLGTHYLSTQAGHSGDIPMIGFSSSGRLLASAGQDGTVLLWDVVNPARPRQLGSPVKPGLKSVEAVAFEPGTSVLAIAGFVTDDSGHETSRAVLWDVTVPYTSATSHRTLATWPGLVSDLAFIPGSHTLAAVTLDYGTPTGPVMLWDVPNLKTVRLISRSAAKESSPAYRMDVTPNGRLLVTGTAAGDGPDIDGTVSLWRVVKGRTLTHLASADLGPVADVAIAPDGKTVAAVGQDHDGAPITAIWNTTDPARPVRLGQPILRHSTFVTAVAFSPDGKTMVDGSEDRSSILWDVRQPAKPVAIGSPLAAHAEQVQSVAFAPDGRTLVTGGADGQTIFWQVPSRIAPQNVLTAAEPLIGAAATVWNSPSGDAFEDLGSLFGTRSPDSLASVVGPDRRTIAATADDGAVRLFDLTKSGLRSVVEFSARLPGDRIVVIPRPSPAFDSSGKLMASFEQGAAPGQPNALALVLWDLSDPSHPRIAGPPIAGLTGPFAMSKDGRLVVALEDDESHDVVAIWDIADKSHPRRKAQLHVSTVTRNLSVVFSPDATTLALADGQDTSLWALTEPGRPRRVGRPIQGQSGLLAFSPDGRLLAVASAGLVNLWDIEAPEDPVPLGDGFDPHYDPLFAGVEAIAFTPNGHALVTAGDKTIKTWSLDELLAIRADPIAAMCRLTDVSLTAEEWQQYAAGMPQQALCA